MGWFWGNSEPTADQLEKPLQCAAPHTEADDLPKVDETQRARKLTRDEEAEAELRSVFDEFQTSDDTLKSSDTASNSRINTSSISPSALYPTSMSCRAAFDSAFYCQSLGGQWNNVYRYGELRNCKEKRADFWFCMRTNRGSMNDERRKEKIREHYKAKDQKYREGKSSEDVWEMRDQILEGALEGDLDAALKREEERASGLG